MSNGTITTVDYYGYNVKVEITSSRPHTINWNNAVYSITFLEEITMCKGRPQEMVKPVGYTTQIEMPI